MAMLSSVDALERCPDVMSIFGRHGQYDRLFCQYSTNGMNSSITFTPMTVPEALVKAVDTAGLIDPESITAPLKFTHDLYLDYCYVASALLFILALRGFKHQETARMGNLYGILGAVLSVVVTLISPYVFGRGIWLAIACAVPPAVLAVVWAKAVQMTSMPQTVGLLNAFGGLAAVLESVAMYVSPFERERQAFDGPGSRGQVYQTIFYLVSAIVGTVTFTGSLVACGKLSGHIASRPWTTPARGVLTLPLLLVIVGLAAYPGYLGIGSVPLGLGLLAGCILVSGVYGILAVMAIGGADMPVVISILNSTSGWAGVFAGLSSNNTLVTIAGAFVGASGIILSIVMCNAMNRSLHAVLLGGFGDSGKSSARKFTGNATTVGAKDVAEALVRAGKVIIVPGYGMAAARAADAVAQISDRLMRLGISVKFGVHPVAGRLPGHMNVLLADAKVPYDIVLSMDEINDEFGKSDVVIVIGANDTVNPAASTDPDCAIYGMPILRVWEAKQVIIMKRSLQVGYSGADNPLFFYPNVAMLLGNAKSTAEEVASVVNQLAVEKQTKSSVIKDHRIAILPEGRVMNSVGDVISSSVLDELKLKAVNAELRLGVVNELSSSERRVMVTPTAAAKLVERLGIGVVVESGAGIGAGHLDCQYAASACTIVGTKEEVYAMSDVIAMVGAPDPQQLAAIPQAKSKVLICAFANPGKNKSLIEEAARAGLTLLAMDIMPRITTAQCMDVLSSTAKVAGFRAVIEAFTHYGRLIGPEITAAGKFPPAKVLILGAGVAGLQAIGDSSRMGGDVRAFDVRLECREQVESMGGTFLVVDFASEDEGEQGGEGAYANITSERFYRREMELIGNQAAECDVIICTAAIPGKKAPVLLKEEHVQRMHPGSVIVDLAAASGGNCEVTRKGVTYVYLPSSSRQDLKTIRQHDMGSHVVKQVNDETVNSWEGEVTTPAPGQAQDTTTAGESQVSSGDEDTAMFFRSVGVTVVGASDLPSKSAPQVSDMYANNLLELLKHMGGGQNFQVRLEDVIVRAITLTHAGQTLFPPPRPTRPPSPPPSTLQGSRAVLRSSALREKKVVTRRSFRWTFDAICVLTIAGATTLFSLTSPDSFVTPLFVTVLSCWVGYLLIWNVTPALHTPLMSITNAISGVVVLGGIVGVSEYAWKPFADYCGSVEQQAQRAPICSQRGQAAIILNCFAVAVASMNLFGGFAVTHRMLGMFKHSRK